ncbi:MAG: Npun_F5749 family FMN-dependent PPOX-type flavoprotein [Cyanobacteria bacterium J06641_5]
MRDELAPWRSPLARALHLHRSQPQARYFQLATVAPDGKPRNRTVVFRGFSNRCDRLRIVTDTRSDKIAQLNHQPWGEACWYFAKTREQFRLAGPLLAVTNVTQEAAAEVPDPELLRERIQVWQALSENARLQFAWPQPRDNRITDPAAFAPPSPDPATPPETFGLLLLEPQQVDRLALKGNPQDRWLYDLDLSSGQWSELAVNP